MPQLPTYTADIGQAPTGGQRAQAQGNALGKVGAAATKAADTVLTSMEDTEARTALVASTEIRAKYARELDAAANSDQDTDAIKEKMADELSAVGEQFQTSRGAQALHLHSVNSEFAFDEQANAINVKRASAAARLAGHKFLINTSDMIRTNPHYLAAAEKDVDAFVETLASNKHVSPELRAELSQRMKQELNMTAAISMARTEPEKTRELLENGGWDLTPQQRETAVAKTITEENARRSAAEYKRTQQLRIKAEANDKARGEIYKQLRAGTANERIILDNADLTPETQEHLINVMDRMAKPDTLRSDWALFNNLREKIDAAPGTPGRITNPELIWNHFGTRLTREDSTFLENRIHKATGPGGATLASEVDGALKLLKGQLSKSDFLRGLDSAGDERFYKFTRWVHEEVDKAAADPSRDPRELLNPKSPKYIGHAIPRFQTGAQLKQREVADRVNDSMKPKKSIKEFFAD
jgi:hypothetical protein